MVQVVRELGQSRALDRRFLGVHQEQERLPGIIDRRPFGEERVDLCGRFGFRI